MKNKKFFILHFTFYIIFPPIMLSFLGCTNPTGSATGNLSGTVYLENQVDHSGIVIGIYELAEIDPDIVDANTKWPHIGVKINQMTEFDHRLQSPVKSTQTDANGDFTIKDIPTGRYNLVATKDSFGFRYVYNITINEGENVFSEQCKMKDHAKHYSLFIIHYSLDSKTNPDRTSDITLYPEMYINNDINEETVFESSRHYIISPEYGNNLEISGDLTIEPGAVVRLNPGVKLTISGDLTAKGEDQNMIWFTSNDPSEIGSQAHISRGKLMTYDKFASDSLNYYNRVELTGSLNKQVSYCKFDHAGTGLLNNVNGFSISHCIFRNSLCGFHTEGVDSAFCSNLLCEDITNEQMAGIYFEYHTNGIIEKNICVRCENGIKVKTYSNPEVKNNYITNCNTGIDISYYSSPDVHNNEIYGCEKGTYTHVSSYPEIDRNAIQSYYGIITYACSAPNIIQVHYNNLNCVYFAIYIESHEYISTYDISAEYNYFYTTEPTEIDESIFDKNDVEGPNQQYYGIVNYIPFLTQEYYNAGIKEGL